MLLEGAHPDQTLEILRVLLVQVQLAGTEDTGDIEEAIGQAIWQIEQHLDDMSDVRAEMGEEDLIDRLEGLEDLDLDLEDMSEMGMRWG